MSLLSLLLKLSRAETLLYKFPEGKRKFQLRALTLQQFSFLPRRAFVNEGDTVLHAGVWRIETVEEWADAVGDDGHVIIVEADPQNAEILQVERTRRELNNNVTIVNRAVWHEKTQLELLVSQISCRNKLEDSQTFLPERPNDSFPEEKLVQADTIDNIVSEVDVDGVDHIHTEISGAEVEAIQGMERTLRQPSVRIWMRAIHILEDGGITADKKVAKMLRKRGLEPVHAKNEPDRHGGNVYAARYDE